MFLLAGEFIFYSLTDTSVIISSGRYLEAYSKAHTADAITALVLLRPAEALLLSITEPSDSTSPADYCKNGDPEKGDSHLENAVVSTNPGFKVEKIDASLLEVGDIVRIQSGATPPSDATIVSGSGIVFDESSLTGESRLIKKNIGDKVFLGTINKGGMVDARVDAIGGATM
jgi:cation transport ATPase